jgi:flagellar hook assembly protein FlgD
MGIWQDVQKTLGRTLNAAQQQQATTWISQALTIIGARAKLERTTIDNLDDGILDMVVTEAVANRLKRPDDATQVSVQVDDAQVNRTYKSSSGQIEIRDEWWKLLFPDSGAGSFTVKLAYTPDHHHHGHHHHDW